jgi:hypothetical protein
MNTFVTLTFFLFFVISTFDSTNGQWYIIKKDYPTMSMNYPNPGKRSQSDIDCSIPYSSLTSYEDKATWLLSCNDKQSPLITVDDSSSSSSESNSIEDDVYPPARLILHERRTSRSVPPPYFNEKHDLFNIRLMKRLRRLMKKE